MSYTAMNGARFHVVSLFAIAGRSKVRLLILLALVTAGALIAIRGGPTALAGLAETWESPWSHLIGLGTLIVALFVWYGEAMESWRNSLPCKLTATFTYKDNPTMVCHYADLAGEGDMRALGQQIGSQMADDFLKFSAPSVVREGDQLESGADGQLVRHYSVEYSLLQLPTRLQGHDSEVLVWEPPFAGEPVWRERADSGQGCSEPRKSGATA